MLFSGRKRESFLIFLLALKGLIVLCVLNRGHDPKVHDIHSKSIINWLILFLILLSPLLRLSSYDKNAKKKKFWNCFFELHGSKSNRDPSASSLTASRRYRKLIFHNEAEKWEKKVATKASQLTCLDINLMHLCFSLVCQLFLCGVLSNHQTL